MAKRIKDKRTNNELQSTTQKTKDRATRTPLKTGVKGKPLCYSNYNPGKMKKQDEKKMTKNKIDPDACTIISIMVLHQGIV